MGILLDYGSGYGYGYGDGYEISRIQQYAVIFNKSFGVLTVGCESRTIDDWRENWATIARDNGLVVRQHEVDEILTKVER